MIPGALPGGRHAAGDVDGRPRARCTGWPCFLAAGLPDDLDQLTACPKHRPASYARRGAKHRRAFGAANLAELAGFTLDPWQAAVLDSFVSFPPITRQDAHRYWLDRWSRPRRR